MDPDMRTMQSIISRNNCLELRHSLILAAMAHGVAVRP